MKKLIPLLIASVILITCSNPSDKFLGTWIDPKISGNNIRQIEITRNESDYLVDFKSDFDAGYGFRDRSYSFKKVGKINGTILEIDEHTKLSLIENGSKILLYDHEFIKLTSAGSGNEAKNTSVNSFNNFDDFYKEFKKHVLSNSLDIDNYVEFPFVDFNSIPYGKLGLSCKTSAEFTGNYSKIFTASVIEALKNGTPSQVTEDFLTENEKKAHAKYLLQSNDIIPSLLFGTVNGRYKLIGLKYFE